MSSVAARPNVKGTVEQVMSGELFSGLLLDDADQRALALEVLLGQVVDDDTRLLWVGNPLRSPLTLERFLIQIVGPEIDLRQERGPAAVARVIAQRVRDESRLLIVVQQPETIGAELRDMLVQMGGYLGGEPVQVQFLFAGSTAFVPPQLAQPDFLTVAPKAPAPEPEQSAQPHPRRRDVAPLLWLLLTITLGALISVAPTSPTGVPLTTAAVAVSNRPPPPAAAPSLRQAFDAFVERRTPPAPRMTEIEKEALFNQFLTHHRRE